MDVNDPAPDFELPDLQGDLHRLRDYRGRIVVVNFWSAECPHSERTDRDLLALLEDRDPDVVLLPVASNRNEPLEMVAAAAKVRGMPRVLLDRQHAVADLYDALTTPHVFVVDRDGILRYRGAVDDITFRQRDATRFFLRDALDSLGSGRLPSLSDTPAYGCAIVREI